LTLKWSQVFNVQSSKFIMELVIYM